MKVAIVDTDIANLGSVRRVVEELGHEAIIARKPGALDGADCLILPGVGSFVAGMESLHRSGFVDPLRAMTQSGVPLLGICLGMQLLCDHGEEAGGCDGLGLIPGRVEHIRKLGCNERVPHMGWNSVEIAEPRALFDGVRNETDFYFVHSYVFRAADERHVLGTTQYGVRFSSVVGSGKVFGVQFHPEKSSRAGFKVIENFLDMA